MEKHIKKEEIVTPYKRKDVEHGITKDKTVACTKLFITINHDGDGNLVEAFIRPSKSGGCEANLEAIGRMVSLALRYKVPLVEIIHQLHGIRCKACTNYMTTDKNKDKPLHHFSCPDAISKALGNAHKYYKGEHKNGKSV